MIHTPPLILTDTSPGALRAYNLPIPPDTGPLFFVCAHELCRLFYLPLKLGTRIQLNVSKHPHREAHRLEYYPSAFLGVRVPHTDATLYVSFALKAWAKEQGLGEGTYYVSVDILE